MQDSRFQGKIPDCIWDSKRIVQDSGLCRTPRLLHSWILAYSPHWYCNLSYSLNYFLQQALPHLGSLSKFIKLESPKADSTSMLPATRDRYFYKKTLFCTIMNRKIIIDHSCVKRGTFVLIMWYITWKVKTRHCKQHGTCGTLLVDKPYENS